MTSFWSSIRIFLWLSLITGIAYPLLILTIAQFTMTNNADGNLVLNNGIPAGSSLIAQKFESDKYFWPRPSAVDYDPLHSGGSNLGPTSAALKKAVEERKARLLKENTEVVNVPVEMLYASGSGLDPHISPAAARFQIERIVKARNFDGQLGFKAVSELVDLMTEKRDLKLFGEPRVNVFLLNIQLDQLVLKKASTQSSRESS